MSTTLAAPPSPAAGRLVVSDRIEGRLNTAS